MKEKENTKFKKGDNVVYKPFKNCRKQDVSSKGKIIENLGSGMYKVTFGYSSMYGTRTGNYNHTNLFNYNENGN